MRVKRAVGLIHFEEQSEIGCAFVDLLDLSPKIVLHLNVNNNAYKQL